jgi:hypothetical protein
MSDDLVKRLRQRRESEFIDGWERVEFEDGDALDAADRIEDLERQLALAQEHFDHMAMQLAKLERLTKDLMLQLDELDFLKWEGGEESIGREIERAKAEARNAALEEAAEWLDNYDDFHAEGFAELVRALKTEPKP